MASSEIARLAEAVAALVQEVSAAGAELAPGPLRAECSSLCRKVSLLSHLAEEVVAFVRRGEKSEPPPPPPPSSSSTGPPVSSLGDLKLALEAARRFLSSNSSNQARGNIAVQLQYVTWQLEKVLGSLPYEYFEISDEVQEQVELVRTQLKRATEKNGTPNMSIFQEIYQILNRTQVKELRRESSSWSRSLLIENVGNVDHPDHDVKDIVILVAEVNGKSMHDAEKITSNLIDRLEKIRITDTAKGAGAEIKSKKTVKTTEEAKNPDDPLMIPEDFRCPISLELMRDPVIVSTGQTYERSFIQRWIDCGHRTCPKTQQKLQNLTLTPNYVLRSLINQWCETHKIEQPRRSLSRRIRKNDGSYHDLGEDRAIFNALVCNLTSRSLEERRSAAAEIRSLAKRSTDNRVLLAAAGAIPALVSLLSVDDPKTQEHAVTSLLNLSIYDNNKELIMLAGAITSIIQVLRKGSMEARENAAAAIFSLSLNDENKITIGGTPGAIECLVELLYSGSARGKKDAATALFNLCIYQGNKSRALRTGILKPLLQMLRESSSSGMVDEALTILSVLVSHQEGKVAIAKANTIPVLIDLLRTGQPRNKENAAAILLALCKKDCENLACLGRLGAVIPLTDLSTSGTDRAKRKATSLLEHLSKLQRL
ncbi:U-box domain-containing protein 10-like [Iris pallida]|uniref:RING-type E3 ubiquitin transferase n=1 Tax=Iris pallida TaxID=29817 RepID=A0AAX6DID5_IRIPA|nr:U-box domain-containing protein 10-like [Iris pallida]